MPDVGADGTGILQIASQSHLPPLSSEPIPPPEPASPTTPRTSSSFFRRIRRPTSRQGDAPGRRSQDPAPARPLTDSFLLNKALPAPPLEPQHFPRPRSAVSDVALPSQQPVSIKRSTSFTALSLVHASLGVAIPPLLPHPLNLSPEFSSRPSSYTPSSPASPPSSQGQFQFSPAIPRTQRPSDEYRRKRGLSLGPLEIFSSSTADTSPKGERPSSDSSRQPTRRNSLWRLRVSSLSSPQPSNTTSQPPSKAPMRSSTQYLPLIHAGPPLAMESFQTRPSSDAARSSRSLKLPQTGASLRRRHSAREPSMRAQTHATRDATIHETEQAEPSRPNASTIRAGGKPAKLTNVAPILPQPSRPKNSPPLDSEFANYVLDQHRPLTASSPLSSNSNSFLDLSSPVSEEGDRPVSFDSLLSREDTASDDFRIDQLLLTVPKTEVAAKFASSGDEFHSKGLRRLMNRFNFAHDPIDIGLRKLLMELGLPKETQQIDRVIEAFSQRYSACNPDLFVSNDHPYLLAFSLIMLHTDAFNKSNKRKMTKVDYVKNTQVPGLPSEILEYFYDNILFAPFIFIEEPADFNDPKEEPRSLGDSGILSPNGSSLSVRPKSGKLDAYFLIANDMLSPLRVNVDEVIPPFDPFHPFGTLGTWNEKDLRQTFEFADYIEVGAKNNTESPIFPSVGVSGPYAPISSSPSGATHPEAATGANAPWVLRVTKVGLLERKDDVVESGKRSTLRKWKQWSVILTGSQLLFFRDSTWALALMDQKSKGEVQQSLLPHLAFLRPDELISLLDTVAVFDTSYTKHANTIRLVLPTGRQILLRGSSEHEINEWTHLINYASAFRTAGIRMRTVSGAVPEQSGMEPSSAAVTPQSYSPTREESQSTEDDEGSMESCPSPTREALKLPFPRVDKEGISPPLTPPQTPLLSLSSDRIGAASSVTRNAYLKSKLVELDIKIKTLEEPLGEHMRLARNLSTLTPFLKTTRERLQVHVQGLSRRILSARLELAKLRCHQKVLAADLESAKMEEEANQNHHRLRKNASFYSLFTSRMPTASLVDGTKVHWNNSASLLSSPEVVLPRTSSSFSRTSLWGDLSPDTAARGFPDREMVRQTLPEERRDSSDSGEQAEEWFRTRAGNRVSLVDLPPGLSHGWYHDEE